MHASSGNSKVLLYIDVELSTEQQESLRETKSIVSLWSRHFLVFVSNQLHTKPNSSWQVVNTYGGCFVLINMFWIDAFLHRPSRTHVAHISLFFSFLPLLLTDEFLLPALKGLVILPQGSFYLLWWYVLFVTFFFGLPGKSVYLIFDTTCFKAPYENEFFV